MIHSKKVRTSHVSSFTVVAQFIAQRAYSLITSNQIDFNSAGDLLSMVIKKNNKNLKCENPTFNEALIVSKLVYQIICKSN